MNIPAARIVFSDEDRAAVLSMVDQTLQTGSLTLGPYTRELEDAIRRYLSLYNDEPKPFVWTRPADDILASIERFCLRTSDSVH